MRARGRTGRRTGRHRELKIGSYFSQPASRIRACRQIPVHARQPAARRRAQQAGMQANPSACTPRAAAAGGRPAGHSVRDGGSSPEPAVV